MHGVAGFFVHFLKNQAGRKGLGMVTVLASPSIR